MLMPDQIERCNALWRRLYARGAVRWTRGMVTSSGRVVSDSSPLRVYSGVGPCLASPADTLPNFNDPATLGYLLAMLREASDDPRASVVWYSAARQWVADWQGCEIEADNEPEALLLAIEEATNATDR
jgi:hypothetical protein